MTQQLENETLPPTPPLPATDPWINESVHQAGDSMNWGWWKISKCSSILPGAKPFSLQADSIVLHLSPGLRWKVFLFLFLHNHPPVSVHSRTCLRNWGGLYQPSGFRVIETTIIMKRNKHLCPPGSIFEEPWNKDVNICGGLGASCIGSHITGQMESVSKISREGVALYLIFSLKTKSCRIFTCH